MKHIIVMDAPESFLEFLDEYEELADAGIVLLVGEKEYFVELLIDN